MNVIAMFNRTIDYLETTLDSVLDEEKIRRLSGYSLPMFGRLFSVFTSVPLAEYLRSRRLSCAAVDLREGHEKIIDIALKYGYESSDAFSYAFRKFHGSSPSEVRKGASFRLATRVQLALTVQGGRKMNVRIEKKAAFKLAGLKCTGTESSDFQKIWKDLYAKYSHEELTQLGKGQSYGMCSNVKERENILYMAAYDLLDSERAKEMNLEIQAIDEAEYAIFELKGKVPECIHAGWKYAMEVFFPEQGYVHTAQPDFEVYGEGEMDSEDYQMELWIPIQKAQ